MFSSVYIGSLDDAPADSVFANLPPEAQEITRESVGAARIVAQQLGAGAEPYLATVNDAFLSGLSVGCFVAAGVAFGGAVFAGRFLPSRAM